MPKNLWNDSDAAGLDGLDLRVSQCFIRLNMPRQSIETVLHAFIPATHTDLAHRDDIAEAILFFASDHSAKTTGGMLNVDGGLVATYVR